LVAFLLGVCLFGGLESIGMVGPDEPRYAWIARAMARTGDWITPRLWGHPWFEKPILFYWSAASAFRVFGLSDRTARLPSALAALAAALLLAWAAARFYGRNTAMLTLAIFPTTLGLLAFAHAATMDMLLTASLDGTMVGALFAIDWPGAAAEDGAKARRLDSGWTSAGAGSRQHWAFAAVGAFIGLGTLAKGPVAIILAGGSVLLWAVLTRRWRNAIRFFCWETVGAFAIVALPWYVACSLVNPSFAHSFLWHQNVQRFLTPVFEHVQPWWFFFPVLALGLLPWTASLLLVARDGWHIFRSGRASRSPGLFVACWAAFPLLFFSFSESKLPGYTLPAIPPLVLLLARSIGEFARDSVEIGQSRDRLGKWAMALVGLTWIALSATAGHWLRRLPQTWDVSHRNVILAVLAATAAAGLAVFVLALAARMRLAVGASALSMGILVAAVAWVFLPEVGPYLSARDAARAGRQIAGQNATIETYGLTRDWVYGLDYYWDRELPDWSPFERQPAWIYTTPKSLAAMTHEAHLVGPAQNLPGGLILVRVSGAGP
jgi:4-amino-4-deoxy-L-arabinose transferase-like glycosyltransferase